jgi:hypothetical protein
VNDSGKPGGRFQALLDAEFAKAQRSVIDPGPAKPDVPDPDAPPPPKFQPTEHDLLAAQQAHKGVVQRVRQEVIRPDAPPPLPKVPYSPPNLVVPKPSLLPVETLSAWGRARRWFSRLWDDAP